MAGVRPLNRDWAPVVVRKKARTAAAKKDEEVVDATCRAGAEIETVRKAAAGTNKAASCSTSLNTRKLDEETENLHYNRVPTELKKAIMEARMDKKLTQSQLAQLSGSEYAKVEIALGASDIKDEYKEVTLPPKWKAFHTVIFLEKDDGLQDASKIAAFDFDGCLAKTSVKRIGADAWSLMYPSIPNTLQKLYADGFKLVIFTNESNIDRWKNKRQTAVDSKIGRLNNFIKHVNVPMQVFIACGFDKSGAEDPYRKPKVGMWHAMEKHFNSGIAVALDQSFYVGDAAGRENDHSDADIKFAQAIGLKFYLPEEFFNA